MQHNLRKHYLEINSIHNTGRINKKLNVCRDNATCKPLDANKVQNLTFFLRCRTLRSGLALVCS